MRIDLQADPAEVANARHEVAQCFEQWHVDGATGEITVLLVSELVTNALLHGRPPVQLSADRRGDAVRVEVRDGGDDRYPVVRHSDPETPGGRGLQLVDVLASRWGAEPVDGGKLVWFELDLTAA